MLAYLWLPLSTNNVRMIYRNVNNKYSKIHNTNSKKIDCCMLQGFANHLRNSLNPCLFGFICAAEIREIFRNIKGIFDYKRKGLTILTSMISDNYFLIKTCSLHLTDYFDERVQKLLHMVQLLLPLINVRKTIEFVILLFKCIKFVWGHTWKMITTLPL